MGSPDGGFNGDDGGDGEADTDEMPQHKVTLTRDFYMGKYQVTAAQYAAFLNAAGVAKADINSKARHTVDGYGEQNLFEVNRGGLDSPMERCDPPVGSRRQYPDD